MCKFYKLYYFNWIFKWNILQYKNEQVKSTLLVSNAANDENWQLNAHTRDFKCCIKCCCLHQSDYLLCVKVYGFMVRWLYSFYSFMFLCLDSFFCKENKKSSKITLEKLIFGIGCILL